MAPKLILIKPNRRNHNLIPLRKDDSALIQQLWEHRPKTPVHLFHDQINSREISKFTNRSGGKVVIGLTNLSEGLDSTPIFTTSYRRISFLGNCILGSQKAGVYDSEHCFIFTETCGTPASYRSKARRLTLNPHPPIFEPTHCSRLFTIYRPKLLTETDASTSQDIIDLTTPAKCPKTSSASNSPTVSEQLHLLTTQANQLRISSEQAVEQTKPLLQTFQLANIEQFQYLHAVQHRVSQFFVDLNSEKTERFKLHATLRQL